MGTSRTGFDRISLRNRPPRSGSHRTERRFYGFWRPQVAARRSNTAPRPIRAAPTVGAASGACGRATYAVVPPQPWHLGPDSGAFWPRASFLPLKSGSQSNQALVRVLNLTKGAPNDGILAPLPQLHPHVPLTNCWKCRQTLQLDVVIHLALEFAIRT